MPRKRKYDLVLFGATGFTGRLVAGYLSTVSATESFHWAIAGRDRARLEALQRRLGTGDHNPPDCLQADVGDDDSLAKLAAASRVVISTVGPYQQHGEPLVRACVEQGSDYADITGEPEFVAAMRKRYGSAARAAGLRLIHCCGFDCIPADLGAWFTVQALNEGLSNKAACDEEIRIEAYVSARGELSGGTWHSAVNAFARLGRMPRGDGGRRDRRRSIHGLRPRLRYQSELNAWSCPLPTMDPQVVLESATAMPEYGLSFEYGHNARVGSLLTVIGGGAVIGGAVAVAQLRPGRDWLLSLKAQGDGPDEQRRQRGRFNLRFHGESRRRRVRVELSGGDPGYGETAKMLAESGLCLALDRKLLSPAVGFMSSASAMAAPLVTRLQRAGIDFELLESEAL